MGACCGKAIIRSEYKTLSRRLLDYGEEAYSECTTKQNVVMWVFSFFNEKTMCKTCRTAFGEMYDWFTKYNLFDDPSHCVRFVVEPEPENNLVYKDLGMEKLPAHVFCDSNGRIFEIVFEFPDTKWLETYILPFIQSEGRL